MKKILGLGLVAILVMALVGGGTWAYFSDTETVAANLLTAGTLDLSTGAASGVLSASGMVPGQYVPSGSNATVTLQNLGSINASSLTIGVSYVEDPGELAEPADTDLDTELNADDFADGLIVDTLDYDGTDLLALVTDNDADGKDMKEVAATSFAAQAGINASSSKTFKIQVHLKSTANNDFQADGINTTFTFTLNQ